MALTLALAGCSFAFVQPAHEDDLGGIAGCTSEPTMPVVDAILTLTNAASAVYVGLQSDARNRDAGVAVGAAFATVFLASAIYGAVTTSRCADLKRDDPARHFLPPAYPGGPAWRPPVLPPPAQ